MALADGAYAEEGWRIRKDGSRFWASVVITAVHDETGAHVGFAKVTRDQTERRLAEEQREQAAEQQKQFLAVTAHELRTPIAVVDGSVTTVLTNEDRLPEEERRQLLVNIRTSARRLQQLTNDLLTASRLDANSLGLVPQPTRLEAILTSAVARAQAARPGIELSVDGDLDVEVSVDPERIGQAVDNLILNAIRHGEPPIRISGGRDDGGGVVIRVSDSGPGVADAIRPRLFQRFASSGKGGGTGLGLYVVREITRMHGGEVRYEHPDDSRPSQFVLSLPSSA
jgi:signal transduction histidine kinase